MVFDLVGCLRRGGDLTGVVCGGVTVVWLVELGGVGVWLKSVYGL